MSKAELDSLLWLDTSDLKRMGYLKGNKAGSLIWASKSTGEEDSVSVVVVTDFDYPYIQLSYSVTDHSSDEKKHYGYTIYLTDTSCNFGGKRYWFLCPLFINGRPCSRRVRRLYKRGGYFGCRNCHNLTYASQNESYHQGPTASLFRPIAYRKKAEELEERMKVRFYKGKPTRNMRRYLELLRKSEGSQSAWMQLDDFLGRGGV